MYEKNGPEDRSSSHELETRIDLESAAVSADPAATLPTPTDSKVAAPDPEATLHTLSGFEAATSLATPEAKAIGPYKLVRKLGEGGMGQVWLAEQTEPVKRTVALKLIRVGLYDEDVLQRFRAERQSLAMMDHPAIAKVFDAGATPDGQPYFVMDYVPGVPITQYCDDTRLTIRQRLDLLIKVCEGVQHAHQKAIIHRDLKPANILVSEVDGKPVPRIIDFGLAKATAADTGLEAALTRVGGFLGTPGYMSPEQADSSGQDIDTRTDVYSLGVILYVLLTGVEPFDSGTWKNQPLLQVLRHLRDADPPTPSTKLHNDPVTLTSSAEFRGVAPRQLESLLHGDLDWITMKALEKERERRYGSPMELAADIERFLKHEPIVAHPASAGYRLRKYIRRHRVGVGVAAGFALLLAGFAVMQAVELRRIARERDRANRNAEIAEKNRSEATKQAQLALDTIYDVVTRTDETLKNVAGTAALRKQLLEHAMKNLDDISRTAATSTWADRTAGVALQRMAVFYDQMGMTKEETEALERSILIFERLMKQEPNQDWNAYDAAISYENLGEIGRETQPDPTKVYQNYETARQLKQQLLAHPHQEKPNESNRILSLAVTNIKLSALALELHDPAAALENAQQAVALAYRFEKTNGSGANGAREATSSAYFQLARARLMLGDENAARDAYARVEQLRREAVRSDVLNAYAKQELGRAVFAIGDMELELGNIVRTLDRYHEAEAIFTELSANDKVNAELKWYLANTQYGLGNALQVAGKPEEAKRYLRECLKTRTALFNNETSTNIQRRIELMLVNAQLGNIGDALRDAGVVEQYAPNHPGKLFSAACAYALSARFADSEVQRKVYAEETVRLLHRAIACGFKEPWTLQHTPELLSVGGNDSYQQLWSESLRRR